MSVLSVLEWLCSTGLVPGLELREYARATPGPAPPAPPPPQRSASTSSVVSSSMVSADLPAEAERGHSHRPRSWPLPRVSLNFCA